MTVKANPQEMDLSFGKKFKIIEFEIARFNCNFPTSQRYGCRGGLGFGMMHVK